tara:strand:+ start:644 stop:1474 length:831 start_codon:yes stop_codon:yes gene_type:complete
MAAEFYELSPAKLNLFLKIINKREDGYHNIRSGVTLINLFDEITAEKNSEFKVSYIGDFAPLNNKYEDCIVTKLFSKFNIFKPNYFFTIKKNIPVQSGLGSASSNVAAVIRILEKLNYTDIKSKNFAELGADIPFFLRNHDSLIRGIGDSTIDQFFPKYYFLLIKPLQNCSTVEMYKQINLDKINYDPNFDTDKVGEHDFGNDFEIFIEKKYPEIADLKNYLIDLPDVIFSRLSGSGSCFFAAFESKQKAELGLAKFNYRFPDLWAMVVENNFVYN